MAKKSRKVTLSLGIPSDLVAEIDKEIPENVSRSSYYSDLLRKGMNFTCEVCSKSEELVKPTEEKSRNLQSQVRRIIDKIYKETRTHATTIQILEYTRKEGFDDARAIGLHTSFLY